eukprot:9485569-Pyramimonas_sp.AAC.1
MVVWRGGDDRGRSERDAGRGQQWQSGDEARGQSVVDALPELNLSMTRTRTLTPPTAYESSICAKSGPGREW